MHLKFELLDGDANNFIDPNIKLSKFHPKDESYIEDSFSVPLPIKYLGIAEEIRHLEVYPDDVWVLTYPKCGTTVTQEAVWQICNGVTLKASGLTLDEKFPFIERNLFSPTNPPMLDRVKNMQRPRFIKSHLPPHLLPEKLWTVKPKIVLVFREPKDAACSYFHHYSHIHGWKGSKEEFFQLFLDGNLISGDFWLHTKSLWALKDEPNVKVVRFEHLKHNLKEILEGLASFLEKPLTDEQMSQLMDYLSFDKMKNNPLLNKQEMLETCAQRYQLKDSKFSFVRKGKVGSHAEEMSEEFIKLYNEKTNEQFKGLKLKWV